MSQSSNTKENKKHIKQTFAWLAKVLSKPVIMTDGALQVVAALPNTDDQGMPEVLPEYAVQTSAGTLTWLPRDGASLVMRLLLQVRTQKSVTNLNHFVAIPLYIKSHWRERHRVDTVRCTSHVKNFWEEDKKACGVHGISELDKIREFVPGQNTVFSIGAYGEMIYAMGRAAFPFVAPMCIHSAASEKDVVVGLHRERPYYKTDTGSLSAPGAVAGHIMIDDYKSLMDVLLRLSKGLLQRHEWLSIHIRGVTSIVPCLNERQEVFDRQMRRAGV